MPSVARKTDPILGTIAGEHMGHPTAHPPTPLTGNITTECVSSFIVNGLEVAVVSSRTTETDACCAGANTGGEIIEGSPDIIIEGKPLARVGDTVQPHNGTAKITGGSPDFFVNGE